VIDWCVTANTAAPSPARAARKVIDSMGSLPL
jgi:hypothetical protein